MFCKKKSFSNLSLFSGSAAGFTLIEMLVVVAVIGILSSVILNALGPARNKAKDARIIQEVNQARSLAETLYNGTYDNLPNVDPQSSLPINNDNLTSLINDIATQGGQLVIRKSISGTSYVMYSQLNTLAGTGSVPQTDYYCVDSAGHSDYTTDITSLTDPNQTQCPVGD